MCLSVHNDVLKISTVGKRQRKHVKCLMCSAIPLQRSSYEATAVATVLLRLKIVQLIS